MKAQSLSFAWLIDDEKAELPVRNDECVENPSDMQEKSINNSQSIFPPTKSEDESAHTSDITEKGKKEGAQKQNERSKSRISSKSKQQAATSVQAEKPLFTILDGQTKSVDKTLLVCIFKKKRKKLIVSQFI